MKKYKVIKTYEQDKLIGLRIGDIVTRISELESPIILVELPKRLKGKGIIAYLGTTKKNYISMLESQLEEIKND